METIEVKQGQIWQDADPRIATYGGQRRLLRIVEVGSPGPLAARVVSWYEEPDGADGWKVCSPERPSGIMLSRFRPTASGYHLIQDAPEEG